MKPISSLRIYRSAAYVLIMAAIAGMLLFAIFSERKTITDQAGTHANEDIRVADMIKIARLAEEQKGLAARIEASFQSATDTVAIIEELERVASLANIKLEIGQAERVDENGENYLRITADAAGSWNDIYTFFADLDVFSYKHDMRKIDLIRSSATEADGGSWKASMEMNVHMQ
jgi:hypothetical protein